MRILVSGLPHEWAHHPSLGFLVTPKTSYRPERVLDVTDTWACDNDCFDGLDRRAYERMLGVFQGVTPGPLWVLAPDVVGDAAATLQRFGEWEPLLRSRGFPVAFALQDGQECLSVPWERLDAVFVGGSTQWKLSAHAWRLCAEARSRGKLVHMGRVNGRRRTTTAVNWGCDTIDGSGFSKWKKVIEDGVAWVQAAQWRQANQLDLFGVAHARNPPETYHSDLPG